MKKRTYKIFGVKLEVRTTRELQLLRMAYHKCTSICEYHEDQLFDERTDEVLRNLTKEVDALFNAFFYMDLAEEPFSIWLDDILELKDFFLDTDLFIKNNLLV